MVPFKSLILGLGNAGLGLHVPCLRKMHALVSPETMPGPLIAAVDPAVAPGVAEERGVKVFRSLHDVRGFGPEDTVVHICTSPATHPAVIRQASGFGYTRVLSEKPIAASRNGVEEVRQLENSHGLDVLVVANWLHSQLTARLVRLLESNLFGPVRSVVVEQHKPRFTRTLTNPTHGTAFDVEIPHQVALTLLLAGRHASVVEARSTPMRMGGCIFPHMGSAEIVLRHTGGVTSFLRSDLTACRRERRIQLEFDDHLAVGYFPVDRDENFSRLDLFEGCGRLISSDTFEDDVLTSCFADCYSYFAGKAMRPISNVAFHADVTSAIDHAKLLSGATPLGPMRPEEGNP